MDATKIQEARRLANALRIAQTMSRNARTAHFMAAIPNASLTKQVSQPPI